MPGSWDPTALAWGVIMGFSGSNPTVHTCLGGPAVAHRSGELETSDSPGS